MDCKKSKAYEKLVEDMQKRYPIYQGLESDENIDLFAPYVDGEMICKEINLYTYWQGFNYAKNTPKIKYLFVAQDFGSIFGDDEGTRRFIARIKKMNDGDQNVNFFDDDERFNNSVTDNNLIAVFNKLYDLRQRNNDLFFTNFCLGYRRVKEVGMSKEWMMKDADLFKRLYEILEPENIICMGKRTFECVYKSLTGKDYSPEIENFNDFLNNHENIYIKRSKKLIPIYPISHCGTNGIANRIADPIKILQNDMKPIEVSRPSSPFAEYLFKLMSEKGLEPPDIYVDEYKDGDLYLKREILDRKIFSDLRKGKINVTSKNNILKIIFAMKLSSQEATELLAKAGYEFSDKTDKIILQQIKKRNFNKVTLDIELRLNNLEPLFK